MGKALATSLMFVHPEVFTHFLLLHPSQGSKTLGHCTCSHQMEDPGK